MSRAHLPPRPSFPTRGALIVLSACAALFGACAIGPVDPAGRACDDAHACAGGFTCAAGACELSCAATSDCPDGRVCAGRACVIAVIVDAGTTEDAGTVDDAGVDAGTVADAGVVDAGPNAAPTLAAPAQVSTRADTAVDIALAGVDDNGDSLTYVVVTPPGHGSAVGTAAGVRYTPDFGFAGFDSVGVAASDGIAQSSVVAATIYVVGRSCAHVLTTGGSIGDGVYPLDVTPDVAGDPDVDVLCDMTNAGGGWSLALKVDGTQNTFCFDNAVWTEDALLNETSTDASSTEAKLAPYVSVAAGELLIQMIDAANGADRSLVVPFDGALAVGDRPLRDNIADGTPLDSLKAVNDWTTLFSEHAGDFTLSVEGVDAIRSNTNAVRIGSSGFQSCCNKENAIGIGMRSTGCNGEAQFTAGMHANSCCTVFDTSAFARVWVRSRDFTFLPPERSCDEHLARGHSLSGTYRVDADGPGGANPQPVSCDLGDFRRLIRFDAATDACPFPLVPSAQPGGGCVRGVAEGGPVSITLGSPVPYSEMKILVEATATGSPGAFGPSTVGGGSIDTIYVDGVSVTQAQVPGGPRQHVFTFAAGTSGGAVTNACPCDGGQGQPSFVGRFECDTTSPLFDFTAQNPQCQPQAAGPINVSTAPNSTGAIEVRLMSDQGAADEDIALTRLEIFVR